MTVDRPSDPFDDHVRAAAGSFGAGVADDVDVELALADTTRRRRGRGSGAILAVLAVIALATAALVANAGNGDVDVAIDDDQEETDPDPVATTAPRPDGAGGLALGAPDDGKDSVGLPIVVEPATGLVDGQMVTVTGTGFPPNQSIGVVMCTKEAGREYGGRGVEACNLGHVASTNSDADGVAVAQFSVRRMQMLDDQPVDCASEPGRCLIGMGMVSDYDTSGGALIDFDPGAPLPEQPTVELTKTTGIVDGETVGVTAAGLVPGSYLGVSLCDAGLTRCAHLGEHRADTEGNFDGPVRLWRSFGAVQWPPGQGGSANVDCALERCLVQVEAETLAGVRMPPVDVGFDPSRGQRPIPVAEEVSTGPYRAGDTVTIRVTGVPPGAHVDASLCGDGTATDEPFGEGVHCPSTGAVADSSGTAEIALQLSVLPSGDVPCECVVAFGVYAQGPEISAPPLMPDPITVQITG